MFSEQPDIQDCQNKQAQTLINCNPVHQWWMCGESGLFQISWHQHCRRHRPAVVKRTWTLSLWASMMWTYDLLQKNKNGTSFLVTFYGSVESLLTYILSPCNTLVASRQRRGVCSGESAQLLENSWAQFSYANLQTLFNTKSFDKLCILYCIAGF